MEEEGIIIPTRVPTPLTRSHSTTVVPNPSAFGGNYANNPFNNPSLSHPLAPNYTNPAAHAAAAYLSASSSSSAAATSGYGSGNGGGMSSINTAMLMANNDGSGVLRKRDLEFLSSFPVRFFY